MKPYQPSETDKAEAYVAAHPPTKQLSVDEAAALWMVALGNRPPHGPDEYVTCFVMSNRRCARCGRTRECIVVLEGFKGEIVDGNALLCDNCINIIL